jgi:hypothetical protein
VYELLLGKGFRGGGGRWKALLGRHQARLKAELARLKVHRGVSRNEDLLQESSRPGQGDLEAEGREGSDPQKAHLPPHLTTVTSSLPGTTVRACEHAQDPP